MTNNDYHNGNQFYHDYYAKLIQSAFINIMLFFVVAIITYMLGESSYILYIGWTISILLLLNTFSWLCRYWFHRVPIDKSWKRMESFLNKGMLFYKCFHIIIKRKQQFYVVKLFYLACKLLNIKEKVTPTNTRDETPPKIQATILPRTTPTPSEHKASFEKYKSKEKSYSYIFQTPAMMRLRNNIQQAWNQTYIYNYNRGNNKDRSFSPLHG